MVIYEGLKIQETSPYGIVAQEGGKICVFDMGINKFTYSRPAVGMDTVATPYLKAIPYAQSDDAVPVVGGRIYDWLQFDAYTSSTPKYRFARKRPIEHRYMYFSIDANANYREGCYVWGMCYKQLQ